jgi:hypothetical protein
MLLASAARVASILNVGFGPERRLRDGMRGYTSAQGTRT